MSTCGTREKVRGSPKSIGVILWRTWMFARFHSNHIIVVTDQSHWFNVILIVLLTEWNCSNVILAIWTFTVRHFMSPPVSRLHSVCNGAEKMVFRYSTSPLWLLFCWSPKTVLLCKGAVGSTRTSSTTEKGKEDTRKRKLQLFELY